MPRCLPLTPGGAAAAPHIGLSFSSQGLKTRRPRPPALLTGINSTSEMCSSSRITQPAAIPQSAVVRTDPHEQEVDPGISQLPASTRVPIPKHRARAKHGLDAAGTGMDRSIRVVKWPARQVRLPLTPIRVFSRVTH